MAATQFNDVLLEGDKIDLFSDPPLNTAFQKLQWVDYHPTSQIRYDSPVEFCIPPSAKQYIDFRRSYLLLKIRVTKEDGSVMKVEDNNIVAPINLPLHSIWHQVDLYLNQKLVSSGSNDYHYKSYIETLLDYGMDAKKTQLQSQGWFSDSKGLFNSTTANKGFTWREGLISSSRTADLIGALHCDFMQQERLLINGVEVMLKLWTSKTPFFLMAADSKINYKVEIKDAVFKVCKVTLAPELLIAHSDLLKQNRVVKYPYQKTEVKTFGLMPGQYSFRIDNMFQGNVPDSLIIGLVASQAYAGDYAKNPFEFLHKNITLLGVFVDDESQPAQPLKMNFGSEYNYVEGYSTLFSAMHKDSQDTGINIDRDDYAKGYTLFVFDFSARAGSENISFAPSKSGNLRIEGSFSEALSEPVTVIMYAKFSSMIQIDESRSVIL